MNTLKGELHHIAQYIRLQRLEMPIVDQVSRYFDEVVVWSMSKKEWKIMNADQRAAFADTLTHILQQRKSTMNKEQLKDSPQKTGSNLSLPKQPVNGNSKTNGAPKALVVKKTAKGPKLTDAAKKIIKPAAKTKATVKTPPMEGGKVTKMAMAQDVFKRLAGKGRKEMLNALMKDAKLTRAGAQTYYYLLLKKM